MSKFDIVLVIFGKEKGKYYLVVDSTENYVYIANGLNRPISNPKKKNMRHVQKVAVATNATGKVLHDCDVIKILSDYKNVKNREASLHCQKKMW